MTARITVLVDNMCYRVGLCGEHGLALMVETKDGRLLLDTGQGVALGNNLWELFPGLDAIDVLVLSHGHYDHTGGLGALAGFLGVDPERPESRERLKSVCVHPDLEEPKFGKRPEGYVEIGMAEPLSTYFIEDSIVRSRGSTEPLPGVFFLGELPRTYPAPYPPGAFFTAGEREDVFQPDPLLDDTGIVLDLAEGLVVLTGCNHSGLGNLGEAVRALFPDRKVRALIGGLHLGGADEEKMRQSTEALREMDVQLVCPMHCTGLRGYEGLKEVFGEYRVRPFTTGEVLDL